MPATMRCRADSRWSASSQSFTEPTGGGMEPLRITAGGAPTGTEPTMLKWLSGFLKNSSTTSSGVRPTLTSSARCAGGMRFKRCARRPSGSPR